MQCVFEDAPYVGISKLISYLYSESDTKIIFANGNGNLIDLLCDNCLMYIDVVPDNDTTVTKYNILADEIINNRFKRCFLIPIPCIEYICIRAFDFDRNENVIKAVIESDKYRSIAEYRGRKLSTKSFEKYCKSVLYNYMKCTTIDGSFWNIDCLCDVCKKDFLCNDNRRIDKASKIILQLPISCSVYNHKQFKNILSVYDIQRIYLDCIDLLRGMTTSFMNNFYIEKCKDLVVIDYVELNR